MAQEVNVDDYLQHVGEFGKKQAILQVMFCILIIPSTYQKFIGTFVGSNPAWRCTGLNAECNHTKSVSFKIGHEYYNQRCSMKNRTSWEFVKPKKFSIVTEVKIAFILFL